MNEIDMSRLKVTSVKEHWILSLSSPNDGQLWVLLEQLKQAQAARDTILWMVIIGFMGKHAWISLLTIHSIEVRGALLVFRVECNEGFIRAIIIGIGI